MFDGCAQFQRREKKGGSSEPSNNDIISSPRSLPLRFAIAINSSIPFPSIPFPSEKSERKVRFCVSQVTIALHRVSLRTLSPPPSEFPCGALLAEIGSRGGGHETERVGVDDDNDDDSDRRRRYEIPEEPTIPIDAC